MKYADKIFHMEGVIVEIHDGSVYIDMKERLGSLKIPKRMLFCDAELKIGQRVGWSMSYPEQLDVKPVERYVKTIETSKNNKKIYQQKAKEIRNEY